MAYHEAFESDDPVLVTVGEFIESALSLCGKPETGFAVFLFPVGEGVRSGQFVSNIADTGSIVKALKQFIEQYEDSQRKKRVN